MSEWKMVLLEPAREISSQVGKFLIDLLLVIVILIIGWIIAKAVKSIVVKVLTTLKLDDLSAKIELSALLEKGGVTNTVSEIIGIISYWFVLLVTFMVAINAVGLTIAASLLQQVILYVPRVVSAIVVIIFGMFAATLLRNITEVAANNAGVGQSKLLSKIVAGIIMVFVLFIAQEQLGIGIRITQITLAIVLGSIGLGLALAFGLGCKDIVAKYVHDFLEKIKTK